MICAHGHRGPLDPGRVMAFLLSKGQEEVFYSAPWCAVLWTFQVGRDG